MADAFGQARTVFVAPSDQPWSQPFRLWRDAAKTQPYAISAVGGKLQWPGGTSQVDLAPTLTANVITPALTAETLASMRSGTWWGEVQFLLDGTTAGQLRFDLKVQPGYGSGLGAAQSLGMTCDLIVIDGAVDVFMLDAGPIGPPGAGAVLQRTAALDLSGQRVVKDAGSGQAAYADPSTPGDAALVLGVTTTAALQGFPTLIQCIGDMVDPAWSWTPGLPLYCGAAGQLTQTPPTSGWLMRVGVAVLPTQIVIGLDEPTILAS